MSWSKVLLTLAAVLLGTEGATAQASAPRESGATEKDLGPPLTERERVAHVLNRMSFGPRPGQVDELMKTGVEAWMREQLEPASIDNSFVDAAMAESYSSLAMSNGDLFRTFRPPYENDPPSMQDRRLRGQLSYKVEKELRDSVYFRAVYSERQFEEIIVAFWREHFSVDQGKDDVGYLANNWETDVIRKYAFGKFEYLLMASARHPAMLVYLDNIVSQKPLTEREEALLERYEDRRNVPSSVRALQRQRGLNENYARELMELHTLGVDREYTQRDVTELARVMTGWTARWTKGAHHAVDRRGNEPMAEYGFFFERKYHDPYDKIVLGTRLKGSGEEQGIMVVRALARHPYTADYISRKLCRYLLRDEPSEALVKSVTKVFDKEDGDLRKVYEAIVFSDDFFYRQNHRVKFKTPFEYVVSALRATGAEIDDYNGVDMSLRLMGQATYRCPDPTGWDDTAEAWLDPGVLVYRWTFALDLAGNKMSGVRVPESLLANLPGDKLKDKMIKAIVPSGLSDRTEGIIDETLGKNPSAKELMGVLLGSPDFQQQ